MWKLRATKSFFSDLSEMKQTELSKNKTVANISQRGDG